MHEMATNAAKFGALSVEGGSVRLGWEVGTEAGRRSLRLNWTETGGPPVSAADRTGFGTTLIERVLARETGRNAVIDYAPGGVNLAVDVPMLDDDGDGAPFE